MSVPPADQLSRREKQIMDVLHRRGRATAAEVRDELTDPPTLTSVRTTLRILEEKGHLRHVVDGPRFVFLPRTSREVARQRALTHLIETFFNDSPEELVSTLLGKGERRLPPAEIDRLAALIAQARRDGR